jgi:cytochrome P450/NADPH-cytochrome P450 reductase
VAARVTPLRTQELDFDMSSWTTKTIPQPKPHLLLGNAPDIDPKASIQSMMKLARENGPIFRITAPGTEIIIVSSQELVNEVCDETRFDKRVSRPLLLQRDITGPTLFTSHTQEPDWHRGHRALQPGFGVAVLRTMVDSMWDIAEQLLLKWERLEDGTPIDVSDDMTRLTLDTIALCAFGYRFNSFYSNEMHPFVTAMVRQFQETSERMRRPAFMTRLMVMKERQRAEDSATMRGMSDMLLARRKQTGPGSGRRDLLDLMLAARGAEGGEGLSDAFISGQLVGLLVAGHETTSGLLSFVLYLLSAHPEVLAKAVAEVDRVLGDERIRFEHLTHLTYVDQVLKEALRLWPTAPAFSVYPYADTVIGGGYPIRHDQTVMVLLPMLHRDPKVWSDPEVFDPDRFAPEKVEALPPNAWKPFGNGQRSCIGRPFALQEAQLVVASILQRFDIAQADPGYTLKIKQALTIKPDGFFLRVKRRDRVVTTRAAATPTPVAPGAPPAAPTAPTASATVQVLFGSNSGSAEAFAQRITNDAAARGFASSLAALDTAVGALSTAGLVVIVTASYEGHPTDNAKAFVAWLGGLGPQALAGVNYAVFGCGNKDWTRTYQAIPKLIDETLAAAGARRVMPRGEADARADFFGDFDAWYSGFWQQAAATIGGSTQESEAMPRLMLEFVEGARSPIIRQNQLELGTVVANRELVDTTASSGRSKRHIEIALPKGVTYRAGDYLAVLPENAPEMVERALRRFNLPYDAQVVLHRPQGVETIFPTEQPTMAGELLASYVDLGLAATRTGIRRLAEGAADPADQQALVALASDERYESEILAKHVSTLNLLEQFPSCDVSFAEFLQAVPVLKPRQYSISSSPAWSPQHCSITIAVLEAPAWSGAGIYHGVASDYLARAKPGMRIAVSVRPSQRGFHLPEDPATPIIMVAAGTGLAPFRGFLQERAIAAHHGMVFGEALLFFGCGHADVDFIYREELQQWEAEGLVAIHAAFHRASGAPAQYVQERLWADRAAVMPLIEMGARIYVCGDGKAMAPAVREAFGRIYQEARGCSGEQVEAWLADLEKSFRYSQDVFS